MGRSPVFLAVFCSSVFLLAQGSYDQSCGPRGYEKRLKNVHFECTHVNLESFGSKASHFVSSAAKICRVTDETKSQPKNVDVFGNQYKEPERCSNFGTDYGFDKQEVWVDNGCKAKLYVCWLTGKCEKIPISSQPNDSTEYRPNGYIFNVTCPGLTTNNKCQFTDPADWTFDFTHDLITVRNGCECNFEVCHTDDRDDLDEVSE